MESSSRVVVLALLLLLGSPVADAQGILEPAPESIAQVAARVIQENDSKEEVLKKAGQPTTIVAATEQERETWIYHAPPMTVMVEFDAWGVKQVTQRLI